MESDCDDEQLIDDARLGDPRAFKRLVECNQDKLLTSMLHLLGFYDEAEDAVQEAFMRAFTRLDTFDKQSKFSTWLYRIAFNAAISERRKKRSKTSLDQRLDTHGLEVIDERAAAVDQRMLREEEIELIHRALDELSDDHRAILVLRELDDLAYEEIASVLQISAGTVRSRLSRARGRLREVVESLQASVARV